MMPSSTGRGLSGFAGRRTLRSRCARVRVRAAARRGLAAVYRVQRRYDDASSTARDRRRSSTANCGTGTLFDQWEFREPQHERRTNRRHRHPRLSRPHRLPDGRVFPPSAEYDVNLYLAPPADSTATTGTLAIALAPISLKQWLINTGAFETGEQARRRTDRECDLLRRNRRGHKIRVRGERRDRADQHGGDLHADQHDGEHRLAGQRGHRRGRRRVHRVQNRQHRGRTHCRVLARGFGDS